MEQAVLTGAPPRELLVQQVRKWGGATTDAVLDPLCQSYIKEGIEGFIAYRLDGKFAVVMGDPITAPKDLLTLTKHFIDDNHKEGREVIFAIVTETFARKVLKKLDYSILLELCEIPFLDPQKSVLENTGTKGSLVRRKVRHAGKEGVVAEEFFNDSDQIQKQIEQVGVNWLKKRKGPQIHISNIRLFEDPYGKRWFYASINKKIVAALLLNQLQSKNGWLMNRLLLDPEAPHGTPELLVVTALEKLKKEGSQFVSFGMIPREKPGKIEGLNTLASNLTRFGYQIAAKIYKLDGLRGFWGKFEPRSEASYVVFNNKGISISGIRALMHAFNASV